MMGEVAIMMEEKFLNLMDEVVKMLEEITTKARRCLMQFSSFLKTCLAICLRRMSPWAWPRSLCRDGG